ncbi:hypothetical protein V8E36_003415 [Tilletia maclaganii]
MASSNTTAPAPSRSTAPSSRASGSRRNVSLVTLFAVTAVLALSSLPAAAAEHVHHGLGANNGHNQVHAAHVKHLDHAATSSKLPSTSTPLPASSSSSKKGKSSGSKSSSKSQINKLSASNKLGAVMHTTAEGTRVFSVNEAATELSGSGIDTIYSSNATACSRHYTVEAQDTCDIIGHKTHTSTYQIMALNLAKTDGNCFSLQTGMRLCLGRFGSDCQLVHRVRGEETCTDIVRRYDISRGVLLENNPNLSCRNIYDGLNLCVAPGRIVPPAPEGMYVARRSLGEDAAAEEEEEE